MPIKSITHGGEKYKYLGRFSTVREITTLANRKKLKTVIVVGFKGGCTTYLAYGRKKRR